MDYYISLIFNFIFNLFPIIAYFLIHKKFKTNWTALIFYPAVLAIILDYIRQFFMQSYSASYSVTGVLIDEVEASKEYMYIAYASGILYSLSVVGLLLFAIDLHRKK